MRVGAEMVECDVLVIVVIAVGGIYWWLKRRLSVWKRRGIAHVKPRLLMGNLRKKHHITLAIAESYTKLSVKAQLGGFYFLQRAAILPLDARLAGNILTEPHFAIDSPPESWDYYSHKRDFVVIDSTWKSIWNRALDIACDFSTNLENVNGQKIDAFDASLGYNVKFIANCFLGLSLKGPKLDNLEKLARKHLQLSGKRHKQYLFQQTFPQMASLFGISSMDDILKSFEKLITEQTRADLSDKRYQKLIKIVGQPNGQRLSKKIDSKEITRRAFGLFIAGIETSVATTAFCMYELAKSQDIQSMLRREITDILPKSQHITYQSLAHLKYMDAVIFETLRKYPPIGSTWRITSKEYYVPNSTYIIEEGMPVVVPIYAIHHDPRYHVNPEKFDPERFLNGDSDGIAEGTFMPFGRRDAISIEMHFTIMQIKLMLVSLLKEFRITYGEQLPDALAINPKSPTLTPKNRIWLSVHKLGDSAEI